MQTSLGVSNIKFQVYKVVAGCKVGEPVASAPRYSDALQKMVNYQVGRSEKFEVFEVQQAPSATKTEINYSSICGGICRVTLAAILACFAVVYVLFVLIPPDKSSN